MNKIHGASVSPCAFIDWIFLILLVLFLSRRKQEQDILIKSPLCEIYFRLINIQLLIIYFIFARHKNN